MVVWESIFDSGQTGGQEEVADRALDAAGSLEQVRQSGLWDMQRLIDPFSPVKICRSRRPGFIPGFPTGYRRSPPLTDGDR